MFEYSQTITRTAKNYNIQERDVILAQLIAAGITRADAYHTIYQRNNKQDRTTTDTAAAQHVADHPGIRLLIQKIKNRQPINTTGTQEEVRQQIREEERRERGETEREAELSTRAGLTKKMRQELSVIHGKEAVNGLMTLAKLEGFDKEDNREEEEKRRYFLPWRTKCRACILMKVLKEEQEKEGGSPKE